jgi:hypothetical protein
VEWLQSSDESDEEYLGSKEKNKGNNAKSGNEKKKSISDSGSIDDLFDLTEFGGKPSRKQNTRASKNNGDADVNKEKGGQWISLLGEQNKKENSKETNTRKSGIVSYLEELKRKYPSPSDKVFATLDDPQENLVSELQKQQIESKPEKKASNNATAKAPAPAPQNASQKQAMNKYEAMFSLPDRLTKQSNTSNPKKANQKADESKDESLPKEKEEKKQSAHNKKTNTNANTNTKKQKENNMDGSA